MGFVFVNDTLECSEDAFNIIVFDAVESEICRVEFGTELGAFLFLPLDDARLKPRRLGQRKPMK